MQKASRLLSGQPIRLGITILLAFYFNQFFPTSLKEFFLAVSLSLKEVLIFMIPFIIFSSVYNAFAKIRSKAMFFILILLFSIVISNFISVNLAGTFSYLLVLSDNKIVYNPIEIAGLEPLWRFAIPKLISNNIVLLSALILACIENEKIEKFSSRFAKLVSNLVEKFLKKFFMPLLPVFIFGFLLKLLNDDIISNVVAVNPKAFIYMIMLLWSYLGFLIFAAVFLYKNKAIDILRNIITPAITAFSTMSSAAALPFSIKAAEANTNNVSVSDLVMPTTVNTHMIGDSICIPMMAMIMIIAFGKPIPSLEEYLIFAFMFTLTKFSGAGVPGGSILVMIPVLEKYLSFSPEMVILITICYMLIDPIATSGNVIGNNLFVIHFNKFYMFLTKRRKKQI